MGNPKPSIKGQTTQWTREKDKELSSKHCTEN